MMRYQRLSSPDVLPHSNGRKSILRTCKEEDADESGGVTNYNSLDTKSLRLRPGSLLTSPSPIRDQHTAFSLDSPPSRIDTRPSSSHLISNSTGLAKTPNNHQINGFGHGVEGDVLLRWGQRKRSRGSRTEARFAAVAAAAGEVEEPPTHSRSAVRIQRKTSSPISVAAAVPSSCGAAGGRATYLRSSAPVRAATGSLISKTVDDRSAKRSPPRPPEKSQRSSVDVPAGNPISKQSPEPEVAPAAPAEKLNLERFECPRIYLSLSRKEKEDDFLAMKGTKLPQRPKKRAKNIDRTLQYCFPGMWLSDLTRGRYEVREKKCVKKKRRGLKGMESSDSE